MPRLARLAFAALLASLAATVGSADPIVPGTTYIPGRAIQDITLLPNTPFNPTNAPILLDDIFGDGTLVFNRAAQVGDAIEIPTAEGLFFGGHPALGDYVFGSVAPLTSSDFPNTRITNVVQNVNDPGYAAGQPSSLASGLLTLGGPSFGFEFLTGPAAGVKLFTDPAVPFEFTLVLDGLPPSPGSVFQNSGPDVLNVLFNGVPVATSSDRRIVVMPVPEPGSFVLLGVAGGLLAGGRRLRSRTA